MAVDTPQKTIQWLHHFGYLQTMHPTEREHDEAVIKMQRIYGLVEDAIAGPITRRAMGLFRCARSDATMVHEALWVDKDHCKWEKQVITYAIGNSFKLGGSKEGSQAIIQEGFRVYEPLTGLRFLEIESWNEADIRIGRGRGRKWDFDGPGNVLAWAELPCEAQDVQLLSMFDDQEPWNLKLTGAGIIMMAVWLHELGHLLGLDHSSNAKDLMAPYYNSTIIYPQAGDKARLAKVYGVTTPLEEPQKPPTTGEGVPGVPFGAYEVSGTMILRENGGVVVDFKQVEPAEAEDD